MSESVYIALPLDDEGFLRRECPQCLQEFKVEIDEDDKNAKQLDFLYCPYCRTQAPIDQWYTQEQVDYMTEYVAKEKIDPMLDQTTDSMKRLERSSGPIKVSVTTKKSPPRNVKIAPERNDMKKVNLTCCDETIKILDEWHDKVHCTICGNFDFAKAEN